MYTFIALDFSGMQVSLMLKFKKSKQNESNEAANVAVVGSDQPCSLQIQ